MNDEHTRVIVHPPSRAIGEAPGLTLFVLGLAALLDYLAPTVAAAILADIVRAHQLVTLRAQHQRWRIEALVLAAVATAVARNFRLWYGTHNSMFRSFPGYLVADI